MNIKELQLHISFKSMSINQVAFWISKGVTFKKCNGEIVPVHEQGQLGGDTNGQA